MSCMPCTILPLHPNAWMWAPLPAKEKPVINLSFDLTSQGSRFSIQGARAGWKVTVLVLTTPQVRGHQSLLPLQGISWLNSLKSSTRIFGMELTCTEKAEPRSCCSHIFIHRAHRLCAKEIVLVLPRSCSFQRIMSWFEISSSVIYPRRCAEKPALKVVILNVAPRTANSPLSANCNPVCSHCKNPEGWWALLWCGTAQGQSCSSCTHRNPQPTIILDNENLIENTCSIKTALKPRK